MNRLGALVACTTTIAAQMSPRPLRPAIDSLPVEFNRIVGLRELSDGTVLVSDAGDKRLVVADFKTRTVRQIGREGRGPGEYGLPAQLFPLRGDSTLTPDLMNGRWLMLQGAAIVGTIPPDNPAVAGSRGGLRGADARGHILTTSGALPGPGTQTLGKGDSTSLLLLDRSTGRADTIGRLRSPPTTIKTDTDKSGKITEMRVLAPPLSVGEEATIFPDGWVAVARLEPYRIDWRSPDGKWIRGVPLERTDPRMTDREKQAYLARRTRALGRPATPPADDAWPAFIPPFQSRPMLPLPDGRVLIQRTPTADVPRNRYDLVDRNGRRVAIVDLPENDRIITVGTRGAYVIATDEDGIQRIRRHPCP